MRNPTRTIPRIFCLFLSLFFIVFSSCALLPGIGSKADILTTRPGNAPPKPHDIDLCEILKVLSSEIITHHFSAQAEDGRLIVFNLPGFDKSKIAPYTAWVRENYDVAPNYCFILVGIDENMNPAHANQWLPEPYNQNLVKEWTHYEFTLLEREDTRAVIEVGVSFPRQPMVGAGQAYTLHKRNDAWEITDSELTWIA